MTIEVSDEVRAHIDARIKAEVDDLIGKALVAEGIGAVDAAKLDLGRWTVNATSHPATGGEPSHCIRYALRVAGHKWGCRWGLPDLGVKVIDDRLELVDASTATKTHKRVWEPGGTWVLTVACAWAEHERCPHECPWGLCACACHPDAPPVASDG